METKLNGRKILLGVTGGIAAYKAAELCRALRKSGAEVRVVMTQGAVEFITPLTMQALSANPVHTNLLDPDAEAGMGHIELAKWPDLIVVAPASAGFIARFSQGLANDLLTTLLLASEAPVALVPAMNQAMWRNPLTQRNISGLQSALGSQITIWGPAAGVQACGDIGPGRMLEPEDICASVILALQPPRQLLAGKRVVITAGPTREALDPVRYISNHSSGKMGYALAAECLNQGAEVVLVSGPVQLQPLRGVKLRSVVSGLEMYHAVLDELEHTTDIFIAAAAVADYRPAEVQAQKIKKGKDQVQIALTKNPDIVAMVAAREHKPFTVGFAAETHEVIRYAQQKLKSKNLDMIIANDVSMPGVGFNSEQNEVYVIWPSGNEHLERQPKNRIAQKIISRVLKNMSESNAEQSS